MLWILVIVSWGLNANSGVGTTTIYGFQSEPECLAALHVADHRYSTYDAYCIPQRAKAISLTESRQSDTPHAHPPVSTKP